MEQSLFSSEGQTKKQGQKTRHKRDVKLGKILFVLSRVQTAQKAQMLRLSATHLPNLKSVQQSFGNM